MLAALPPPAWELVLAMPEPLALPLALASPPLLLPAPAPLVLVAEFVPVVARVVTV